MVSDCDYIFMTLLPRPVSHTRLINEFHSLFFPPTTSLTLSVFLSLSVSPSLSLSFSLFLCPLLLLFSLWNAGNGLHLLKYCNSENALMSSCINRNNLRVITCVSRQKALERSNFVPLFVLPFHFHYYPTRYASLKDPTNRRYYETNMDPTQQWIVVSTHVYRLIQWLPHPFGVADQILS